MTLYYKITLVTPYTPYIMTSRNTVVYHFREHALDELSQQPSSFKDVKKNTHTQNHMFLFFFKQKPQCFLKREITKVYNCHGNTY